MFLNPKMISYELICKLYASVSLYSENHNHILWVTLNPYLNTYCPPFRTENMKYELHSNMK